MFAISSPGARRPNRKHPDGRDWSISELEQSSRPIEIICRTPAQKVAVEALKARLPGNKKLTLPSSNEAFIAVPNYGSPSSAPVDPAKPNRGLKGPFSMLKKSASQPASAGASGGGSRTLAMTASEENLQSAASTGTENGGKKSKRRPLSNLFSFSAHHKEVAGMKRYEKLQKQAKNSHLTATQGSSMSSIPSSPASASSQSSNNSLPSVLPTRISEEDTPSTAARPAPADSRPPRRSLGARPISGSLDEVEAQMDGRKRSGSDPRRDPMPTMSFGFMKKDKKKEERAQSLSDTEKDVMTREMTREPLNPPVVQMTSSTPEPMDEISEPVMRPRPISQNAGVRRPYTSYVPETPSLMPIDNRPSDMLRKRTSMASLFTVSYEKGDADGEDESEDRDTIEIVKIVETDRRSYMSVGEEDEESTETDLAMQPTLGNPMDDAVSDVLMTVDELPEPPVMIEGVFLPPRPSSPGVDDLEPLTHTPTIRRKQRAPSDEASSSSTSSSRALNRKSTKEVLSSLPLRPSDPGVDEVNDGETPRAAVIPVVLPSNPSPAVTLPLSRQTAEPNSTAITTTSSPQIITTTTSFFPALSHATRSLSKAHSNASLSSSYGSVDSEALAAEQAALAAAAAAAAAAERERQEKISEVVRRSELTLAARLSGVVTRHQFAGTGTKSGQLSPGGTVKSASVSDSKVSSPVSTRSATVGGTSMGREWSFGSFLGRSPTASAQPRSPVPAPAVLVGATTGAVNGNATTAATGATVAKGKSKLDDLMGLLMTGVEEVAEEEAADGDDVDEEDRKAQEEVRRIREALAMEGVFAEPESDGGDERAEIDLDGTVAGENGVGERGVAMNAAREAEMAAEALAGGAGGNTDGAEAMVSKLEAVFQAVTVVHAGDAAAGADMAAIPVVEV
ncbi:hypothetical protein HK101_008948 [Irineochytrium annulatum]|nr:hypothetical protein HK101_008948 [Irineochytrium annulatum]